jgi:hypothetical protein
VRKLARLEKRADFPTLYNPNFSPFPCGYLLLIKAVSNNIYLYSLTEVTRHGFKYSSALASQGSQIGFPQIVFDRQP